MGLELQIQQPRKGNRQIWDLLFSLRSREGWRTLKSHVICSAWRSQRDPGKEIILPRLTVPGLKEWQEKIRVPPPPLLLVSNFGF